MKNPGNSTLTEVRGRIDDVRSARGVKQHQIAREVGEIVIDDLKKRGQFFNTLEGPLFFDREYRRTFPLQRGAKLNAVVNERYGVNPADKLFDNVIQDLKTEALLRGAQVEVHRFTYYDRQAKCLYVSKFDGCVYRLDGHTVQLVDNGTDDVFFVDDESWEPYVYTPGTKKGQFLKELIESVNFLPEILSVAEQRLLLRLWVISVFFGNIQPTKIILLLLGEHGSGKTSALRRIQKFIFGKNADLLSVERDKQDGFIATITRDPIALFDNLDEQIPWLPASLSRLATGVTFSRRQLYTTNDQIKFPSVSWLGITSRTVKFMEKQPDLPDRTMVLKLGRLENRLTEDQLLQSVSSKRNALWSELLDDLNAVVQGMSKADDSVSVKLRMADFAKFGLTAGQVWGLSGEIEEALGKLERAQSQLTLQEELISDLLGHWLSQSPNPGRAMTAGDLFKEWRQLADDRHQKWPFDNPQVLGQRLGQLQPALEQEFDIEIRLNTHSKQREYRFWPKTEGPTQGEDVTDNKPPKAA